MNGLDLRLTLLGGLVLAVAMVLSPVTVWAAAALVLIVVASIRGRTGLERRLILGVITIAILLRVAMIAWLFIASDHTARQITSFTFDGDGLFNKIRSLWVRNIWLGVPIGPYPFTATFDRYGWTSYFLVIGYIQYLFGAAPYAIHLFNVCCYVAGAALLHRAVRVSYGAVPALATLVVTLFFPTLMMWSSAALKESLYFLLSAIVVFALMRVARGERVGLRMAALGCAAAAAVAVGTVRTGGLVITATGCAIALAGAFLTRRVYLLVFVLAFAVILGGRVLERPSVRSRVLPRLIYAANVHVGNVTSEGHSYTLLDQRFYSGDRLETMTWPEAERFVWRGLVSFLVVPLPHEVVSRSELMFMPQQLLWYGLLLLAVPGILEGCRRDTFFTWLLLGLICAAAGVIGLNSGNVGTMIRIRDSVVPFVSCLAGLGAVSVLSRVVRASGTRVASVQDGIA